MSSAMVFLIVNGYRRRNDLSFLSTTHSLAQQPVFHSPKMIEYLSFNSFYIKFTFLLLELEYISAANVWQSEILQIKSFH